MNRSIPPDVVFHFGWVLVHLLTLNSHLSLVKRFNVDIRIPHSFLYHAFLRVQMAVPGGPQKSSPPPAIVWHRYWRQYSSTDECV